MGPYPLPAPGPEDEPPRRCWCGRVNCLETFISGPAVAAEYAAQGGEAIDTMEIATRAAAGEPLACEALDRLTGRVARSLAVIANIFDPGVIVLRGGLSNIGALYEQLPDAIRPHVFSDMFETPVLRHKYGDSSGVRGAAWLWSE